MASDEDKMTKKELTERLVALEQHIATLHPNSPIDKTTAALANQVDCGVPMPPFHEMAAGISAEREDLIRYTGRKWVNETVLHYYFFNSGNFSAGDQQKNIVRDAFEVWRTIGVGLRFEEVANIDQAEIRIGFLAGDGYWSYVGTDVLTIGQHERTMNFGNDLTADPRGVDVPVHEIGHTLGFPHEHQNPLSGIVWNEAAVLHQFGLPPNSWSEDKIRHNILRKIPRSDVEGSAWDRDSIMHYRFGKGLIDVPAEFKTNPLVPAAGLSDRDRDQALLFYPPAAAVHPELKLYQSAQLNLSPGGQANFTIKPTATRDYTLQTFGFTDSVMVLFENTGSTNVFVAGDDDSGWKRNARLEVRLYAGRSYILRIRMYYQWASGDMAVMMS